MDQMFGPPFFSWDFTLSPSPIFYDKNSFLRWLTDLHLLRIFSEEFDLYFYRSVKNFVFLIWVPIFVTLWSNFFVFLWFNKRHSPLLKSFTVWKLFGVEKEKKSGGNFMVDCKEKGWDKLLYTKMIIIFLVLLFFVCENKGREVFVLWHIFNNLKVLFSGKSDTMWSHKKNTW